jgi:hypothetical protein
VTFAHSRQRCAQGRSHQLTKSTDSNQKDLQLRHVTGEQSFTVPSGKRLVIEHVSGFFQSSIVISDRMFLPLSTKVSGLQLDHSLVFEAASLGRGSLYFIDKPVRLYADPGTVVGVPAPVIPEFRLVLSGHFVAVP